MPKYYHGKVTFEYVSDESLEGTGLSSIVNECDEGCAVGGNVTTTETVITRAEADTLATSYGSDETFFEDRLGDDA